MSTEEKSFEEVLREWYPKATEKDIKFRGLMADIRNALDAYVKATKSDPFEVKEHVVDELLGSHDCDYTR